MNTIYKELIFTLTATIAMILISMSTVYSNTYNLFGKMVGSNSQTEYGTGESLSNRGLIMHAIVFALLVFLPIHYQLIEPKYTWL